ncbi:MAG: HEAT repeat domain-containing protein [Acidobacteria bacterium]|nr:HEAT repeat domain-containing protein [Acidobacteriota bacterium]
MRLFKPNVKKMQQSRDVQGLMTALGDQDPEIARDAVRALIGLGLGADLMMAAAQQSAWPVWQLVTQYIESGLSSGWVAADELSYVSEWTTQGSVVRYSPRFVEPFLTGLRQGDPAVKATAVRLLGHLDDGTRYPPLPREALRGFRKLLSADDPYLRSGGARALQALGWQPDDAASAVAFFIAMGQYEQCAALGPAAAEPLLRVFHDALRQRNMKAVPPVVRALGALGDSRVVLPLVDYLRESGETVLVDLLAELPAEDVNAALLGALHSAHIPHPAALKAALAPRAAALRTQLREEWGRLDTAGKRLVMDVWVDAGDGEAIPVIQGLLQHPELHEPAGAALKNLGFTPGHDVASAEYCLQNKDFAGCVAVGRAAIPPLLRCLEDEEYPHVREVGDVLIRLGEPVIAQLTERLKKDTLSGRLAKRAVRIVADIGGPETMPVLVQLMKQPEAAQKAARELEALGWQPGADPEGARYCALTGRWADCLALGEPGVEQVVREIMNGRQGMVAAIGAMDDSERLALLRRKLEAVLSQPDAVRRRQAATVLHELDWPPAEPVTLAWYRFAREDLDGCGQLGAAALEPLLAWWRESPAPSVRKEILTRLAALTTADAVPVFLETLNDSDKEIRRLAAQALVELYTSGRLTDADRTAILNVRARITAAHQDRRSHDDRASHFDHTSYAAASDCNTGTFSSHKDIPNAGWGHGVHKDVKRHTDSGIGLDFPV